MSPTSRPARQRLSRLLTWPVALLILFEEWGWEPLQRALASLALRLRLQWIGEAIARLPPYPALALFLLPSLCLLPVKLGALWLVGHGHVVVGMGLVVAAKVAGTAVVARLFTLTRPALLRLWWFAWAYGHWTRWKDQVLAYVRASWAWRWGRVVKRRWRRRWGGWWRRGSVASDPRPRGSPPPSRGQALGLPPGRE